MDEWPVAMCEKDFEQHRTFADRASAAETLLKVRNQNQEWIGGWGCFFYKEPRAGLVVVLAIWPVWRVNVVFCASCGADKKDRSMFGFSTQDFTVSRNLPVFVDGIANGFNAAYASWPFRWWVLTPNQEEEVAQGGAPRRPCPRRAATVAQKPMPRNAQYDLDELEGWLEEDSRRTPRRT